MTNGTYLANRKGSNELEVMSSISEPTFITSLVAGGAAGIAVDITLFPLDTIKTRLQSRQGFWKAGGFRGIYAGVGPAALGSAPNAAVFFCTYDTVKKVGLSHVSEKWAPFVHMAAASCGEFMACTVRVPVEVIKQRRQTSPHTSLHILDHTLKEEGVRGLYRGFRSMLIREIPFSLIQFPLWEFLKKLWSNWIEHELTPSQVSLCGALAGGVSAGLTTPLDVAKTRIMLAEKSNMAAQGNVWPVIRSVYMESGVSGLYAGIVPRVAWISFGGAVFFGVYEKTKELYQLLIA